MIYRRLTLLAIFGLLCPNNGLENSWDFGYVKRAPGLTSEEVKGLIEGQDDLSLVDEVLDAQPVYEKQDKTEEREHDLDIEVKNETSIVNDIIRSKSKVKATFGRDDQGNVLITIPNVTFKGNNFGSIKIHLAPSLLNNLTAPDGATSFTRSIFSKPVDISDQTLERNPMVQDDSQNDIRSVEDLTSDFTPATATIKISNTIDVSTEEPTENNQGNESSESSQATTFLPDPPTEGVPTDFDPVTVTPEPVTETETTTMAMTTTTPSDTTIPRIVNSDEPSSKEEPVTDFGAQNTEAPTASSVSSEIATDAANEKPENDRDFLIEGSSSELFDNVEDAYNHILADYGDADTNDDNVKLTTQAPSQDEELFKKETTENVVDSNAFDTVTTSTAVVNQDSESSPENEDIPKDYYEEYSDHGNYFLNMEDAYNDLLDEEHLKERNTDPIPNMPVPDIANPAEFINSGNSANPANHQGSLDTRFGITNLSLPMNKLFTLPPFRAPAQPDFEQFAKGMQFLTPKDQTVQVPDSPFKTPDTSTIPEHNISSSPTPMLQAFTKPPTTSTSAKKTTLSTTTGRKIFNSTETITSAPGSITSQSTSQPISLSETDHETSSKATDKVKTSAQTEPASSSALTSTTSNAHKTTLTTASSTSTTLSTTPVSTKMSSGAGTTKTSTQLSSTISPVSETRSDPMLMKKLQDLSQTFNELKDATVTTSVPLPNNLPSFATSENTRSASTSTSPSKVSSTSQTLLEETTTSVLKEITSPSTKNEATSTPLPLQVSQAANNLDTMKEDLKKLNERHFMISSLLGRNAFDGSFALPEPEDKSSVATTLPTTAFKTSETETAAVSTIVSETSATETMPRMAIDQDPRPLPIEPDLSEEVIEPEEGNIAGDDPSAETTTSTNEKPLGAVSSIFATTTASPAQSSDISTMSLAPDTSVSVSNLSNPRTTPASILPSSASQGTESSSPSASKLESSLSTDTSIDLSKANATEKVQESPENAATIASEIPPTELTSENPSQPTQSSALNEVSTSQIMSTSPVSDNFTVGTTPPPVDEKNSFALLTGGRNQFQVHIAAIDMFKSDETTCLSSVSLPFTMYDHMAATLMGMVVLCGGFTGTSQFVTTKCNGFNPKFNLWMPLPDLPFPLRDAAPVSIGSNLFLLGGWTSSPSGLVLKYDGIKENWSLMANLTTPRYSTCAVPWTGGKIVVLGGSHEQLNGQGTVDLNTVDIYDPTIGNAGSLPSMKFARRHHACQLTTGPGPGKPRGIIVAGGSGNGFQEVQWSVEFLAVDNLEQGWTMLANLNRPRCCWPQMGHLGEGNTLYIMSGERVPSDSVEKLDLSTDIGKWSMDTAKTKLMLKRAQSRAIFTNAHSFPQC